MSTQIPRLTDARLIRRFFGDHAKPYDYTVTLDDFDEYDAHGPGHYYGVAVPEEMAARWDEGIRRCEDAGVHTRSREGLLIRWQVIDRDATELPPDLVEVAEDRDRAIQEEEGRKRAEEERKARETAGQRLVEAEGLTRLPISHTHVDAIAEISARLHARGVTGPVSPNTDGLEELADTGDRFQHTFRYYRLPSGDVLKTCPGIATDLYTSDVSLIRAYHEARIRACEALIAEHPDEDTTYSEERVRQSRAALRALVEEG